MFDLIDDGVLSPVFELGSLDEWGGVLEGESSESTDCIDTLLSDVLALVIGDTFCE